MKLEVAEKLSQRESCKREALKPTIRGRLTEKKKSESSLLNGEIYQSSLVRFNNLASDFS